MDCAAMLAWEKASEHLFVHVTGARIERKGYPLCHGWYLTPSQSGVDPLVFEPTPEGCDQAFIAFAAGWGMASPERIAG
jgi:hypothetical protein